jgi:hypothetical protein
MLRSCVHSLACGEWSSRTLRGFGAAGPCGCCSPIRSNRVCLAGVARRAWQAPGLRCSSCVCADRCPVESFRECMVVFCMCGTCSPWPWALALYTTFHKDTTLPSKTACDAQHSVHAACLLPALLRRTTRPWVLSCVGLNGVGCECLGSRVSYSAVHAVCERCVFLQHLLAWTRACMLACSVTACS